MLNNISLDKSNKPPFNKDYINVEFMSPKNHGDHSINNSSKILNSKHSTTTIESILKNKVNKKHPLQNKIKCEIFCTYKQCIHN